MINLSDLDLHNLAVLFATGEILLRSGMPVETLLHQEEVELMNSMLEVIKEQINSNEEMAEAIEDAIIGMFINSVHTLINHTGRGEGIH